MDNLHLVQFAAPQFPSPSTHNTSTNNLGAAPETEGFVPEPSDAVRTFTFMANLYAQEASGDPAASASPERVLHRLRGSSESKTYIFALVQGKPPIGEVSVLGIPQIPSTGECPDFDYVGFIQLSIPLLEEKNTADVDFVLDVNFLPLPGQALEEDAQTVAERLVREGIEIAKRLGRTTVQTGSLHSDDTGADADPFSAFYECAGFTILHAERQIMIPIPDKPATALVSAGLSSHVWPDYDIPEDYLDDVVALLTVASQDSLTGDLSVEPIHWDRSRLAEAHSRLRSRNAHTIIVALVDDASNNVVALTELGRHAASDPEVAEWTMTITDRQVRKQQMATILKMVALTALHQHWPEVERTYTSIGVKDEAMNRIYDKLNAEGISRSESWELTLP